MAMMIPAARNSMVPVSIPAMRALKVARFSVDGSPEVELVAPVAASLRPMATVASAAATVRPARRRA